MWSRWFNVDSAEGDGDYETLLKIKRKYPEVLCDDPISVQGRVAGSDQVLLHADEFNQRVELNPRVGLICKNVGQHCKNYEVRFCCSKGRLLINYFHSTVYGRLAVVLILRINTYAKCNIIILHLCRIILR